MIWSHSTQMADYHERVEQIKQDGGWGKSNDVEASIQRAHEDLVYGNSVFLWLAATIIIWVCYEFVYAILRSVFGDWQHDEDEE